MKWVEVSEDMLIEHAMQIAKRDRRIDELEDTVEELENQLPRSQ